jgi:putative transposase
MLSERRDEAAATAFFRQAIDGNGLPEKVVMDKSGANLAGLENINVLLVLAGLLCLMVDICQVKYFNNRVEQDHRFTCALWVLRKSPGQCWGSKPSVPRRPPSTG